MTTVPYRPWSGTSGARFMGKWCDRCERDKAFRDGTGDSCDIAAAVFVYEANDPKYPKEWIKDEGDPIDATARCTAFEKERT